MDDLQIGVTGESAPEYCGCGCGERVQGRHSVSHSLGNGRYTLYLSKHDHIWNDAHPAQVDTPPPQRTVTLNASVTKDMIAPLRVGGLSGGVTSPVIESKKEKDSL